MAKFTPYKVSLSQLTSVPIVEGQMILTTDEGALYFDVTSSNRVKIYENALESLDFEIVQTLPTSNIDENTIYLIENGETTVPGVVTYAISKVGDNVVLTGSNGSTSSVAAGLTAQEVQAMIDAAITSALEASY